jgi:CheY-like chemotaxis protein
MARILLIEDDHLVRTMLGLTLVHFGHTVVEACNGLEGLALFPQTNPDLVITDLVMPEKDGLEVIKELRKKSPPVKIIAMSGGGRCTMTNNLATARALGAAKVLAKPFSNANLLAAIGDLVPGAESAPSP